MGSCGLESECGLEAVRLYVSRSRSGGTSGDGVAGGLLGRDGRLGQDLVAVVAICDDSEAPIFEMADFGVVGDVTEVVPQLVEELAKLRG